MKKLKSHAIIPDTQVTPDAPIDHLRWIGRYLAERKPDVIIHLGDHWDMRSLSSYDRGKKASEGWRYTEDIEAGNVALDLLDGPLRRKGWAPRKYMLRGNHENRIERAANDEARLEGAVSEKHFNDRELGWRPVPFLEPLYLDGVAYAHYFYNPNTGRPIGGMIETRLKTVGHSFTQGHEQTLKYGLVDSLGRRPRQGLIAGACYLHEEDYKGPQGNAHWRGIIIKHEVDGGSYDPMFVSLDYLCRRYEDMTLADFRKKYPLGRVR